MKKISLCSKNKYLGGKEMIQESVAKLVQYGLTTGLIEKEDAIYTANRLLGLLNMDT